MISEQNEIVSEPACPRAESPRMIEISQGERASPGKPVLAEADHVHIKHAHQTEPQFAEAAQSSTWKLISSAWLANYWVTSYDTDPTTWVLGCTNTDADNIVPILMFDTLAEAQTLFYRLARARAQKAHARVNI